MLHLIGKIEYIAEFPTEANFLSDLNPRGFDIYILNLSFMGTMGPKLADYLQIKIRGETIVVHEGSSYIRLKRGFRVNTFRGMDLLSSLLEIEKSIQEIAERLMPKDEIKNYWELDFKQRTLTSPAGKTTKLSVNELLVMKCFLEKQGLVVTLQELYSAVGFVKSAMTSINNLNGIIYRLRQRIKKEAESYTPIKSVRNVGYLFEEELKENFQFQ